MNRVNMRYIVNDVDVAIAFYTEKLGFALQRHPQPGFAILAKDGQYLLLNEPGAGGAGQIVADGRVPKPEPGGWNRIQVQVDDIAAAVAELKQQGVPLRHEIITGQGGKQVLIHDPAGNPVELFEPYRK